MGQAKSEMMKYEEIGIRIPSKKNVCLRHFNDYAIRDFIDRTGEEIECNFCDEEPKELAVPMAELMEFLAESVYFLFNDAANHLPYESAEGGYQGEHYTTRELLNDVIGLETEPEEVFEEIADGFPDYAWCSVNPFDLDENEEMIMDWNEFSELTKHTIRYSFYKVTKFDEPHKFIVSILEQTSNTIKELELIRKLEVGRAIYRGRQHKKSKAPSKFEKLCSPPIESCIYSNRMSPAGISMFYGSLDRITAKLEIVNIDEIKKKPYVTIAKFQLKKELSVVDLTELPKVPSVFDRKRRKIRSKIMFLHAFVRDLSKPISKDGKEHIEYVPTQVFTEYFKFVIPEISKTQIDGIIYPSAQSGGKKNCVLFFNNEECKNIFELDEKKNILTESI